ncbi:MAG TPA: hypothetical protein QGI72_00985 [Poseidonia sp.]|nr:hypothetical protein [Poseidonia sp.]
MALNQRSDAFLKAFHAAQWFALGFILIIGIVPLSLAVLRLCSVTQISPIEALTRFPEQFGAMDALRFTFIEALLSTLLTLALGLPIAWGLGRYEWKGLRAKRAMLYLPFVTPPIVAAAGFLALISPGGLLFSTGIDLRGETGFIGWIAELTGWQHPGHMLALIIAHAWFNLSLVIRFVEPIIAQLSPTWEEQLKMLPQGQTRAKRLRHLWLPVLGPSVAVAATYAFFFSFTSFALVKWLTPDFNSLESLLADLGGSAGIFNYRVETSVGVLAIAGLQAIMMLILLASAGALERKHATMLSLHEEYVNRRKHGSPPTQFKIAVYSMLIASMLPLISVIIASFRKRTTTSGGTVDFVWTLEGWQRALAGDASTLTLFEALQNSLMYAFLTLIIALPLGYLLASMFHRFEQNGKTRLASILDTLCMIPLSASAVMIGLGVVIGLLRWYPELFMFRYLPVLPHVMLVLPFLVRMLRPAFARIEPAYLEQVKLLNLSRFWSWWHSKGAFMVAPLTMAASLCLAFSLGEFGATYLLIRVGSWDSLSIMVDQLLGRPKFDPLIMPTAMAVASTLMLTTLVILWLSEQLRIRQGATDD